jgi:phosphoribosyl 1,2-cyclic phosphodiesterase
VRFSSIGSGSRGNATLIEARDTLVLLDCGFSVAETERRMRLRGHDPADLAAILVTHEHGDHIGGVARLSRQYDIPVYLTPGTLRAAPDPAFAEVRLVNCHRGFAIGALGVEPMPVPHDAREPCQFVFTDGAVRLGVLTDTGHVTRHVEQMFAACDALVLECNHDTGLLESGPYPPMLKRRVGGRLGHLNNAQSAALLSTLDHARLQHVVAVHLSEQNNTPELALRALAAAMPGGAGRLFAADQDSGFDWREVIRD